MLRLDGRGRRADRSAAAGREDRGLARTVRASPGVDRAGGRRARGRARASCSARRIARPLRALTQSAMRLGQGDFSASIPVGWQRRDDDARAHDGRHAAQPRRSHGGAAPARGRSAGGAAGCRRGRRSPSTTRATIRYLNPQAARMLGVEAQAAIGRFCGDVLKPALVDGVRPCETAVPDRRGARAGPGPGDRVPASRRRRAAHRRHHERRTGRRPAGAGHARRDRARGRAARARLGAREHLARVPHAARRAARVDRAAAGRPARHVARAARGARRHRCSAARCG